MPTLLYTVDDLLRHSDFKHEIVFGNSFRFIIDGQNNVWETKADGNNKRPDKYKSFKFSKDSGVLSMTSLHFTYHV